MSKERNARINQALEQSPVRSGPTGNARFGDAREEDAGGNGASRVAGESRTLPAEGARALPSRTFPRKPPALLLRRLVRFRKLPVLKGEESAYHRSHRHMGPV